MSQVIVITSGKGGVGKTTTTANIGVGLASLGNKVVLIDTDIGLRNLDIALGMEEDIVYDLVDVVNGICTPGQATIQDKRFDGLYLIPAAQTRDKDAINPRQMSELCERLKKDYDYIIIDCPAGIEQGFRNAVAGADKALIVTIPELTALRDADRVIGLLEANGIEENFLLINKIRPEMMKRGDMMNIDQIIQMLDTGLIGIVPDDPGFFISDANKKPLVVNPKSIAGQCFFNICRRLNGDNVQLFDFDSNSFKKRLKNIFKHNK